MRRAAIGTVFVAALIVAAVAVTAATRHSDNDERELARSLEALVEAGMPGALVRVREDNHTLELARGEAFPGVRFRVGSLTKTFVAALTLRLADRGVLSLDDRVDTYLPGLLRDGDRVTIRRLLNHTAGLFDYTGDPVLLRGVRPPPVLVRIADRRERTTGYAYSSTNYLALGLVLEEATGIRLGELLRRDVFEPFGLAHTTFEDGLVPGPHLHGHALATRDGVATGSLHDTSGRPATSAWAAAAVVSTAADLERFMGVLAESGLAARMAPPDGARYGLGLGRAETPCGEVLGHTGNLLGTVTVVRSRGDRLAIVAGNAYPFTRKVGQRFAELLELAICG
jgi:D-alanyl-D-alanine carboxypeptidase